jgi:amino acid transporter
MNGLGGGLAALAFWGFIASCVVGGIWYAIREKQAQHETLRQIIASGKDVDAEVIDRIMSDGGKSKTDLRIGGYITMSAAPGLALLGYVLEVASDNDQIFTIMVGVAGLVFFVAIGMLFAARVVERGNAESDEKPLV